jgi:NAD(P)-dependent dehydrogenase (short-subunit alcohol dehydrogenase family)
MSVANLEGKRVLVVGASSGIGRAVALRMVRAGASVVMSARRADKLAELVAEAGGGVAVVGDVRDPESCRRIVEEAAATLGGLDLLLYTVGAAPLRYFADTTPEDWSQVLETNLIGPHQVIRAALASLAPGALVAVLSSESVGRPYPGLGAYAASKAALEESLRAWRTEQPAVRFCCVTQGATVPTDFGNAFDMAFLGQLMEHWARLGIITEGVMETDEVADVLMATLAVAVANPRVGVEDLVIRPPFAVVGTPESMMAVARDALS